MQDNSLTVRCRTWSLMTEDPWLEGQVRSRCTICGEGESRQPKTKNSSDSQVIAIALRRKGFHSGKHLTQSGPFLSWKAACNNPRCGSAPRGSVRSASSVPSDCKLTLCGPSGFSSGNIPKNASAKRPSVGGFKATSLSSLTRRVSFRVQRRA